MWPPDQNEFDTPELTDIHLFHNSNRPEGWSINLKQPKTCMENVARTHARHATFTVFEVPEKPFIFDLGDRKLTWA